MRLRIRGFYMKQHMKRLILSACTFTLFSSIHFVSADMVSDTEKLFNWAESTYPQFFSGHQTTQSIEPWLYRYYADKGIYTGVNKNDIGVYLLGGPWGNNPTFVDSLSNMIALIQNSGGNTSIPACNTKNTIDGLVFIQNGNIVNITTNGQCISVTPNSNLCEAPQQTTASGISLLTKNTVISSEIKGVSITIPGIPDPFQSIPDDFANTRHCTINTPPERANLIINSDVCYDMTSVFNDQFQDIPGIAVTPPITMAIKDTSTGQIVADCFATEADTIFDAFTGELWSNQEGTFVKIND